VFWLRATDLTTTTMMSPMMCHITDEPIVVCRPCIDCHVSIAPPHSQAPPPPQHPPRLPHLNCHIDTCDHHDRCPSRSPLIAPTTPLALNKCQPLNNAQCPHPCLFENHHHLFNTPRPVETNQGPGTWDHHSLSQNSMDISQIYLIF
jgi:hypothetical protein